MDSNAAVTLVMLAVFFPVASKILNFLVMLLLLARFVWVSFLLLPLISRTAMLFEFDLGRLTESETLLWNRIKRTFFTIFIIRVNKESFYCRQKKTFYWQYF